MFYECIHYAMSENECKPYYDRSVRKLKIDRIVMASRLCESTRKQRIDYEATLTPYKHKYD